MRTFSDYAYEKMLDLYRNHDHEVGSRLKEAQPELYRDRQSTNCIGYVLNVLKYAFQKIGNNAAAEEVSRLASHGTRVAAYLVRRQGWKGVFINPDENHPADGVYEHVLVTGNAQRKCEYYDIPVEYKATNYRTTGKFNPAFQTVSPRKGVTALDDVGYDALEAVGFGFGVSRGGKHTWLFSAGWVYEVHLDQVGKGLYEAIPLRNFSWLSGAIVVPGEQAPFLVSGVKLRCAAR